MFRINKSRLLLHGLAQQLIQKKFILKNDINSICVHVFQKRALLQFVISEINIFQYQFGKIIRNFTRNIYHKTVG